MKLAEDYQTANVIESLKRAAAIFEPHGIVMVLEPLNWYRNHAGLFLKESPQAFQICKAVNSPSCKILFDIYHQQIQEGNLIPNIEKCWDEIGYFQIGDNPGRNEPTTGEINYKNIFKYIHSRGFDGIMGMEHGNSIKGKEGEIVQILGSDKAIVQGINLVKKHKKPSQEDEGGIVDQEKPINKSNLMLIDPKSKKPTKIHETTEIMVTNHNILSTCGANVDAEVGSQSIYYCSPLFFLNHKNPIIIIMAKSVIAPPNFITFKALSAYFLPTGSKSKQYNNTLSLRDTVPVDP
mgnify:CR=1 FL=1